MGRLEPANINDRMDQALEEPEKETSRSPSQISKLPLSPLPSDNDDVKPQRSTIKAITIVLVVTLSLLVNVRPFYAKLNSEHLLDRYCLATDRE
jgi:hypothetical protein